MLTLAGHRFGRLLRDVKRYDMRYRRNESLIPTKAAAGHVPRSMHHSRVDARSRADIRTRAGTTIRICPGSLGTSATTSLLLQRSLVYVERLCSQTDTLAK